MQEQSSWNDMRSLPILSGGLKHLDMLHDHMPCYITLIFQGGLKLRQRWIEVFTKFDSMVFQGVKTSQNYWKPQLRLYYPDASGWIETSVI